MENQSENNKKTWQEPEISQLTINAGKIVTGVESTVDNSHS
jgi:hypothetical protein